MEHCRYQIFRNDRLLRLSVTGTLRRDDLTHLERVFWGAWDHEDRFLMDFSGLKTVDMSVEDFTQAGLSGQLTMPTQGNKLRAAYVATNANVFAFMRIVESVWSSHLEVQTFDAIDAALFWLGCSELTTHEAKLIASG
jgi:hypothetical protein